MSDIALIDEQKQQAVIAISEQSDTSALIKIQKFTALMYKSPPAESIGETPDGKAKTVTISHIETTLDELFFGQWSLTDTHYQREFNEVIGSGVLTVINPITGREIKRTGFAAIQITQDAGSSLSQFNDTKKKNALDLSFPKLKAEILKNAAQSLGPIFGRDLNRKIKDTYNPLFKGDILPKLPQSIIDRIVYEGKIDIETAKKALLENFDEGQKTYIKSQLNITE